MSVGVIEDYKLRDLRASHTGLVVELEHHFGKKLRFAFVFAISGSSCKVHSIFLFKV